MNVYDEVNNLARALKECREFTEYKEAKDKVKSVEGLRTKIDEFEKIRYEEQLLALQGEKQSEEKMKKLQETATQWRRKRQDRRKNEKITRIISNFSTKS